MDDDKLYLDGAPIGLEGPLPASILACGCYLIRPTYDAILCSYHEAEVGAPFLP